MLQQSVQPVQPTPITQEGLTFFLPVSALIVAIVVAWVSLKYRIKIVEDQRTDDNKTRKDDNLILREWINYENKILLKEINSQFAHQSYQINRLEEKIDDKTKAIFEIKEELLAQKKQFNSLISQLNNKNIDVDVD